ncbi:DNA cytosine methyltransferase [Bradyrhizobium sp. 168]|nr:DNA cytosine methyltransferase [Bradyrhizobium sp. 168]
MNKRVSGGEGRTKAASRKKSKTIAAVDLFCGAGGLTKGLIDAGVTVRLGIDLDEACRHPYERNNPGAKFLLKDISKVGPEEISRAWKKADIRLLAGCAPCQPFSTYTQGQDWKRRDQWGLLLAFARLAIKAKPHIVTMENVPSLARHEVFDVFRKTLEREGFNIVWDVLDCRKYGIPQSRRRLVLIASRLGVPELPRPTHPKPNTWKTVREAIGELPAIAAGSSDPSDPLHVSSRLSPINLLRIAASKPGGTWRDWPAELVAPCHKRESGSSYPGVYGRMGWSSPSPTITGQCYGFGNGRFGHPKQHRALSLREAAILQTFPKNYSFVPSGGRIEMKNIGQLIGNAVPPRLAKVIGIAIRDHISAATGWWPTSGKHQAHEQ